MRRWGPASGIQYFHLLLQAARAATVMDLGGYVGLLVQSSNGTRRFYGLFHSLEKAPRSPFVWHNQRDKMCRPTTALGDRCQGDPGVHFHSRRGPRDRATCCRHPWLLSFNGNHRSVSGSVHGTFVVFRYHTGRHSDAEECYMCQGL
ncbi:hypothetical protein BC834DRAFT_898654 [Gloeopeniophorella convolvens]|nr:hypothetical protein BC834DRAFT_898654 [Gloeopeniophorella convolvens]